ncbi:glycosyltransferase [Calothrix sp. PCC 6303]|uniref:glycosyltransferase n=1 Tax=Calothrix sp. PCC 6303 TaxID=1170562 RepID=UPI0002A02AC3|nr:glycosyltransferase [Calothrix sp. PCC 6303]AFZ01030.1 glycosyl transferase group 1 [Calothrix sp. PCC 6303]
MKKIAVFYPYFMGGGAETVALWMLQALVDKYDLTLFTLANINFEKLDSMYGTSLSNRNIKIFKLVPDAISNICHFLIANNQQLRMMFIHLVLRMLKQKANSYDLVISGYNAADLGDKIGIHYIHWTQVLEEGLPIHQKISNFSQKNLLQNVSVANSRWIANRTKEIYGVDAKVVYPPVVMEPQNIPWHQKENTFICSGRIVKAKEPHRVIKILKLVREQGFDIKLHLTGGGGGIYGWKYNNFIHKIVQENSDWITLHENLPYQEYIKLVSVCKYGIHFKREPFGISIAEMVKAGAIPFVKGEGGQIEIVGEHNQELFFNTEEEAVNRIVHVLSHEDKRNQLIISLANQVDLFSTGRFMSEINVVVEDYFNRTLEKQNVLISR